MSYFREKYLGTSEMENLDPRNVDHFLRVCLYQVFSPANKSQLKSSPRKHFDIMKPCQRDIQMSTHSWWASAPVVWYTSVKLLQLLLDLLTQFIGPSVDDQAVSLSDDGTTIIIDFFSFSLFLFLPPFNSSHSPLAF